MVTIRDHRAIHTLYYFHRYIPASIAKLYGCTPKHITDILKRNNKTVVSEVDCQICGMDECQPYYIDGKKINQKPQNIIQLCEPCKRKFQHLQLKRRRVLLKPQLD